MVDRSVAQPEPPSVRIAAEIRRRIAAGELRAGDRVPSARQITREWGVALATATKVLTALRQEGLVRAVPGVGTVVQAPPPRPAAQAAPHTHTRGGPRASDQELTRERIVRTAIAIADAEGLSALSMRRVAAELGVATMSLYRHVPGKEELVVLMADAVTGEHGLPEPSPPGWRAQLEAAARLQWVGYRRHLWLAQAMSYSFTRPPLVPNGMAHTEWMMRAVDGLGLDLKTMLCVAVTVSGFVRGVAVNLESRARAEQDTGLTDQDWMDSQDAALREILGSRSFPMLAGLAAQPDLDLDVDTLFEFGLRSLLDGFEALIAPA